MQQSAAARVPASRSTIGFMNGLDALFLVLESPQTPMHVGSLHLLDLPRARHDDFAERVRARIARRLHEAEVFTRRLAPMPLGLASPAWVAAEAVDLDHHVRRLRLAPPGTRALLLEAVASLHAQPLDRDRPLWEMVVIEGLASGQLGFYAKVHHAGLDGHAGVALAQAVYDVVAQAGPDGHDAGAAARERVRRRPPPGAASVALAGARHNLAQLVALGRRLPGLARAVAAAVIPGDGSSGARALLGADGLLAPRTALNGVIARSRAFATASVPIARVRAVADRHEATVNDVVLAVCGGALREWLQARGELPRASLLAAVPVSLRAPGDALANTQAMMARITLATDRDDPLARLCAVRDASRALKGAISGVKSALPTDFPSFGLPWLGALLAALWARGLAERVPPLANVVVSNVPGSPVPLYLEGARLHGFWPVSIPFHGLALNITVQSYAGSLDFGLIACRRTVPDVASIAAAIETGFVGLEAASVASAAPAPHELPASASPAPPEALRPPRGRAAGTPRRPAARGGRDR